MARLPSSPWQSTLHVSKTTLETSSLPRLLTPYPLKTPPEHRLCIGERERGRSFCDLEEEEGKEDKESALLITSRSADSSYRVGRIDRIPSRGENLRVRGEFQVGF